MVAAEVVATGDQAAMGPGQGTVKEVAVEVLPVGMDMVVAAEAAAVRAVVLVALGMGLAKALAMELAVVVLVGTEVVEAAEAVVGRVVVPAMAMEVVRAMAPAPAMEVVLLAVVAAAVDTVEAAVVAKVGLAMAPAPVTGQVKGMDMVELMEEDTAVVVGAAAAAAKVVALAMAPVLATDLVVDTTKLSFRAGYRVYIYIYSYKCVIGDMTLSHCLQNSFILSVCNTKSMLDTCVVCCN